MMANPINSTPKINHQMTRNVAYSNGPALMASTPIRPAHASRF